MNLRHLLLTLVFIISLPGMSWGAGGVGDPLWVANGPVHAIASHDVIDHLFVNGAFTFTDPGTGGMAMGSQTGQFDNGFPQINGPVYALISDGIGGWYIGGQFTQVGGVPRNNLAYVSWSSTAGWAVEAWNPGVNDAIYTLALASDANTLYIGGEFTAVNQGSVQRHYIAALDTDTGIAVDWDPGVNNVVRTMVQSSDGTVLYIGGDFNRIGLGAATRNYAAAISIDQLAVDNENNSIYGQALAWDPNLNNRVYTLVLAGTRMYIGGEFTTLRSDTFQRNHAVAIDTLGAGTVDSAWNPEPNNIVRAIALSGSRVYLGGDFTTLNSSALSQPYLAVVDNTNGIIVGGWRPGIDAPVYSLLLSPAGLIYAGGDFTHVNGQERNRLVALDQATAQLIDWQPSSWSTVHVLNGFDTVLVSGGGFDRDSRSLVYIGGAFDYVGPETGSAVVVDAAGQVDASFPQVDGIVYAMITDSNGGWYLGGAFTRVDGSPRSNLAHIDAQGGVTTWGPEVDGPVYAMHLSAGGSLYVGGDFGYINGVYRPYLAEVSTSDGVLTSWDAQANGIVRAMLLDALTLYVGGEFTAIGGISRNNLAALNRTDASTILTWDANLDGPVYSLQTSANSTTAALFVGGDFSHVNNGINRAHLAELATIDGQDTGWDGAVSATVRSLWSDGATLYVGGDFFSMDGSSASIGGQPRDYLAAVDSATGLALPGWRSDANAPVHVIKRLGSELYVGGGFTLIDGVSRNRLAQLAPANGHVLDWNPSVGGPVYVIGTVTGKAFIGGDFSSVGGLTRRNIAALDVLTGQASSWNPGVNGVVNSLYVSSSSIYLGGQFSEVGGQFRNNLAAIDKGTGLATLWNPDANGAVLCIQPTRDNLAFFVGGEFSSVSTYSRNGIAEINLSGIATVWDAGLDAGATIYSLAISPTTVFLAGDFQLRDATPTAISKTVLVQYLAAIDIPSTRLLDWRPDINGVVKTLLLSADETQLYLGGEFTRVDNSNRLYLAALNLLGTSENNYVLDWTADIGSTDSSASVDILALSRDRTTLFVGGAFDTVGVVQRQNLAAVMTRNSFVRDDWVFSASDPVTSLLANNDFIFAGGQFQRIAEQPRAHFVLLDALADETQAPQTTVSLPGGNYNSTTLQDIAIICDDGAGSGCAITYYALDDGPWLVYGNPITLRASTVLRFFSVDQVGNSEDNQLNEVHYVLEVVPPKTTITPISRVYDSETLTLTLACVDEDSGCAATYFTLDDSTPTESSTRYTGPITISGRTVVKYFSIDLAGNSEDIRRSSFISSQGGSGGLVAINLLVLLLLVTYRNFLAVTRQCKNVGE